MSFIINMLIGVFCLYLLLLIFNGKIYRNVSKLIGYNIHTLASYIIQETCNILYQMSYCINQIEKYLTIHYT